MPVSRYVKRRRTNVVRRRRYTRRTMVSRPKLRANRTLTTRMYRQPVSDRMITKLHYVDIIPAYAIPANTLTNVKMYQTSLFDPDSALGGHQPLWYDQYCPNMYSNYRVFGIKWTVTAINRWLNEPWWFVVRNQNSSTPETSLQTLMERRDCKARMGSSVGSGNNTITLSGYLSIAKVRGVSKRDVSTEVIYEAAYNANPLAMAYLGIYVQHPFNPTATAIDLTVRLTYYCELSGRVTPSGS